MMRHLLLVDGASVPAGGYYQTITLRCKPEQDGNTVFRSEEVVNAIGRPLRPEEEDWLRLLQVIHVADLVCHRGRNEEWNRHITLALPLRDPARVQTWLPLLNEIFGRMTHDVLDVRVEQDKEPTPVQYPRRPVPEIDAVALLSGGLDSAGAAVEVVAAYTHPCFVSSRSSPHVIRAQKEVAAALETRYERQLHLAGFQVQLKHRHAVAPLPESDLSQRGRTLLFAGVAAMVAAARGIDTVTLGENGVMAINCPLTPGRIGGFSTHTAHPDVLALMGHLFTLALGYRVFVRNPLLHKTKTEVIAQLMNAGLTDLILKTHSCWIARQAAHCGHCIPCIVRRFATEAASAPDVVYAQDSFDSPPHVGDGKRLNIAEYLLFALTLRSLPEEDLLLEFSELNVEGGEVAQRPIIDVHRRWADDVASVIYSHPALTALA